MTVLRREMRETLQWCLTKQMRFTSEDLQLHFGRERQAVNRQLRAFVRMEILECEKFKCTKIPYLYSIIDREYAIELAKEQPKPKYRGRPAPKYITPRGVSFVFHMGA